MADFVASLIFMIARSSGKLHSLQRIYFPLFLITLLLPCACFGADEKPEIWSTFKLDEATNAKIGVKLGQLIGSTAPLAPALVQKIVEHSRIYRFDNWYIALNPAHQTFIFLKRGNEKDSWDTRAMTIEIGLARLNPGNEVKDDRDRLARGFGAAVGLIKLWEGITVVQKQYDFFDVALSNYNETSLSTQEQRKARTAIIGPFERLTNLDLLSCFAFLQGDSWKSIPALKGMAENDTRLLDRMTPVDIYETDGSKIFMLLGDTVIGWVYFLVEADRQPSKCIPTGYNSLSVP